LPNLFNSKSIKMKTSLLILFLTASVIFVACNSNNTSKESAANNTDPTSQVAKTNDSDGQKNAGTVNDVVSGYLNLKNSLTNDDGKQAADAPNEVAEALTKIDESTFTPEQKKVYDDAKDDIKEHAEHIEANASNIEHQREHFDLLSQDIIDLVKASGSSRTLYKDFCPMYNNKKGASWLSETKEIKNPYYGKKMSECGVVKEEIKAKG